MHCVYLIRSTRFEDQTYVGLTDDLKSRLKKHNEGGSARTSKYKPWVLVSCQKALLVIPSPKRLRLASQKK